LRDPFGRIPLSPQEKEKYRGFSLKKHGFLRDPFGGIPLSPPNYVL